jgi:hypothetical protein
MPDIIVNVLEIEFHIMKPGSIRRRSGGQNETIPRYTSGVTGGLVA